jgi:hypothetical protein
VVVTVVATCARVRYGEEED